MATTTPNFGWSVPTSSDLVKNGAVAIETLGDSIDASLVDLKGGTTGQVLSKATNTDMDFSWTTPASGASFVGCKIYKATSQTVSAISTYTALTWDAESFDTNTFHDNSTNNSRITIPTGKSGKYVFDFTAGVSTSQVKRIGWYKNGSRIEIGITTSPNYTGGTTLSLTENLTAGDYIEVFVWNDASTIYYSTADFTQIVTSLTATYLGA